MSQKMLINARLPEELRIAVVENDALEELYVERTSNDNYVGNIYKGVVVNIEQGLQAVFVDFGVGQNGFLHISDVEPHYFKQAPNFKPQEEDRRPGLRRRHDDDDYLNSGRPRHKPPIQDVFQRGDEVLVQVIKEGIGSKGPTLSTYISIPGRYLVLMPSLGRVGVSRKITDESVRRKLRSLMDELDPPKGLGFIVRTAGSDRTKKDLAFDLAYLMRLWRSIVRRVKNLPGPVGIYEESDVVIRTIRDVFTSDIDEIIVDEKGAYERAKEFMEGVMPRYKDRSSRLRYSNTIRYERSFRLLYAQGEFDEFEKGGAYNERLRVFPDFQRAFEKLRTRVLLRVPRVRREVQNARQRFWERDFVKEFNRLRVEKVEITTRVTLDCRFRFEVEDRFRKERRQLRRRFLHPRVEMRANKGRVRVDAVAPAFSSEKFERFSRRVLACVARRFVRKRDLRETRQTSRVSFRQLLRERFRLDAFLIVRRRVFRIIKRSRFRLREEF